MSCARNNVFCMCLRGSSISTASFTEVQPDASFGLHIMTIWSWSWPDADQRTVPVGHWTGTRGVPPFRHVEDMAAGLKRFAGDKYPSEFWCTWRGRGPSGPDHLTIVHVSRPHWSCLLCWGSEASRERAHRRYFIIIVLSYMDSAKYPKFLRGLHQSSWIART